MNIHICPFAFADAKISYCTLPPFHKDDKRIPKPMGHISAARRVWDSRTKSLCNCPHKRTRIRRLFSGDSINSQNRIVSKVFQKLHDAGRLELTTEYVVFHHFWEKLDRDIRCRMAALLTQCVSHPHARWEQKSRA